MVVKIASSDEHYRYPACGAVLQDKIPYSVVLNAVTQDIVHVKAFKDAMAGNGKACLSNAEKGICDRARTAFQMQHPVDWTRAKTEISITSASSGSRAAEKPRRRTQAEITMAESPSVEGGRGMRSRSALAPNAYNRKRHMVYEHLKQDKTKH
ncbi:hypothetical protein PENSPDRAFT_695039 [Peniophora sp. CONT]|nr:hypothetical protein PENSPDRAFT_695039 [Peniophora sp. CONT]